MLPCSEKSATVCPVPRRTHLVVRSPSSPTGPLAWIRAVLMPTSAPAEQERGSGGEYAPRPKRYPSAKRELEFQNTQALSTCCRNCSAVSSLSVTMTSVWELPYLWMWSTASCMLSTTSMQHSRSPYSVLRDFTSEGLKHVDDLVEERRPQQVPVDEQRLHGVAGRRVVTLGVSDCNERRVDVADALAVAQDRDALRRPLDVPDQLGRAPRDDQVDQLVQAAQILHLLPGAHLHQDIVLNHRIIKEAVSYQLNGVRHPVAGERFLWTLGEKASTGSTDLREAVGPRLEDDQQHPDGDGDLLQLQVVGHPGPPHHAPHAVPGRHGQLAEADGEAVQLRRRETQTVDQRLRETTCRRGENTTQPMRIRLGARGRGSGVGVGLGGRGSSVPEVVASSMSLLLALRISSFFSVSRSASEQMISPLWRNKHPPPR
ncbi:hypothetical protein EYF80_056370 [Liparis tanakae]|uniref:Uncharacterized protein n=1 Tax=Liparis tanakae TaxID=230148 RepID=A0A4Z2EYM6_9TELE|nr:hypothetical protein EYF80_056370 [Liparis tanakae]